MILVWVAEVVRIAVPILLKWRLSHAIIVHSTDTTSNQSKLHSSISLI